MIKKLVLVVALLVVLAVSALFVNNHVTTSNELGAMDMKGTLIETEQGDFRIHDFGEGPALVFLSGMGTTSPYYDFKPIWNELEEDYRIIVLERPGYGYNRSSTRDKSVSSVVAGYREVLSTIEIEGAISVFAHSMGGLEAVYWAQEHPGEIDHLIGLDIAIPPWVLEMGAPNVIERNLQYVLGRSGLARFMEEADMHDALPILAFDLYDPDEKKSIEALFHANFYNRDIVREAKALEENARVILDNDVPSELGVLLFLSQENLDNNDLDAAGFSTYFEGVRTYTAHRLDTHHYVHHEESDTILSVFAQYMADEA